MFGRAPEADLLPVNALVAFLYRTLGPADCCGGPLRGTRYDPMRRQARDQARRTARCTRGRHAA